MASSTQLTGCACESVATRETIYFCLCAGGFVLRAHTSMCFCLNGPSWLWPGYLSPASALPLLPPHYLPTPQPQHSSQYISFPCFHLLPFSIGRRKSRALLCETCATTNTDRGVVEQRETGGVRFHLPLSLSLPTPDV